RHYVPHVNFCIKQVTVNGNSRKYLGTVEDLYRWDYSHMSKANQKPDSQVVSIAKSLMKPGMSNLDKAKAIFSWVQENIKYIAFENGYEGFVPRNAGDVCRRKYGDCKDMSSILVEMMKSVGLQAYMVLIGTDELPYKFSENPLPSSANHMIACVKDKDKYYFLDATGRFYPPFFPTQFIQGKEALISISKDKFDVVTVPTPSYTENVLLDSVYLEILDRKLIGKGKTSLSGYRKIDFVSRYNNTLPENMKDMLNDYLHLGNNKFLQSNHKTKNLDNQPSKCHVTYDFTIDDYAVSFKEGVSVNMSLIQRWKSFSTENQDRTQPLKFNYPSESKLLAILKIPEGYKVGYLPKNHEFENENFGFGIKYRLDKDRILAEQTYRIKTRYITHPMFQEWNIMLNNLSSCYKEVVMLEKSDGKTVMIPSTNKPVK
ncbi:MAG: transglutaminase-like domain-containing protein, partial [Cytophagales bacterium]